MEKKEEKKVRRVKNLDIIPLYLAATYFWASRRWSYPYVKQRKNNSVDYGVESFKTWMGKRYPTYQSLGFAWPY